MKIKNISKHSWFFIAVSILLAACGGGGGGSTSSGSGPTPSYTIGGTVSGLTGAGLVLRNNGGDDLWIRRPGQDRSQRR